MIYQLPLQMTGLLAGFILIVSHALGLINPSASMRFAGDFPRSRAMGTILLLIATIWSFFLVKNIDLGEFSRLRGVMLVGIVAGAILSWLYVEEFLSVRALGMLLLLAADPLLESSALRSEPSRLLLVILAYAWIVAGLFFVGMPYILRDALKALSSSRSVWCSAAWGGLLYGVALALVALLQW